MSTTVHITCGLPASGKTTFVRTELPEVLRFNLDDYRDMMGMTGDSWSNGKEAVAIKAMLRGADVAVDAGFDIALENTHLTQRLPRKYKTLFAGRVTFEVHDFTHVPIEECIARDISRERSVGEDVIRKLAKSHAGATKNGWRLTNEWMNNIPPVRPYTPDAGLHSAIICDIDGTLALHNGRGPYEFARCGEDLLNTPVRDMLARFDRDFRSDGPDFIILLSGRDEGQCRKQTVAWLNQHHVPYDELHMRPAGDTRDDIIVKAELFDKHVRNRFNVRVSLDDRDRVVRLWRRMGIPTWQVNEGDF